MSTVKIIGIGTCDCHSDGTSSAVTMAVKASRSALKNADKTAGDINLISSSSVSISNIDSTEQIMPRVSFGVHNTLGTKNAYAYDNYSSDGLIAIEESIAHTECGGSQTTLLTLSDNLSSVSSSDDSEICLKSGATAAVISHGETGYELLSSNYGYADMIKDFLKINLIFNDPEHRPMGEMSISSMESGAESMAQKASYLMDHCLQTVNVNKNEINQFILPDWPALFTNRLAKSLDVTMEEGHSHNFVFCSGVLSQMSAVSKELENDELVAVIGYGFGAFVGCHIYKWRS